jgi:hypothetical protein
MEREEKTGLYQPNGNSEFVAKQKAYYRPTLSSLRGSTLLQNAETKTQHVVTVQRTII